MSMRSQSFYADDTFTVPASVSAVMLLMVGAGGGGVGHNGAGTGGTGCGGSSGEFCHGKMVAVTPGGSISIKVGAGGAGLAGYSISPPPGVGNTSFGAHLALPARGHTFGIGGTGGGVKGGAGDASTNSQCIGNLESISYFGGTSSSENTVLPYTQHAGNDYLAGGAGGTSTLGTTAPGGRGGGGCYWQHAGNGGNGNTGTVNSATPGGDATGPGGGGGSAGSNNNGGGAVPGGDGLSGTVQVFWFEP